MSQDCYWKGKESQRKRQCHIEPKKTASDQVSAMMMMLMSDDYNDE
jgi:hypothetical protein